MHPMDPPRRRNYLVVLSTNLVRQFEFQEKLLTFYTLYDGLPGAGIYAMSLLSSSSSSKYLRKIQGRKIANSFPTRNQSAQFQLYSSSVFPLRFPSPYCAVFP